MNLYEMLKIRTARTCGLGLCGNDHSARIFKTGISVMDLI